MDTDNKGEIKYDRLVNVFNKLGISFTEKEIKNKITNTFGYCNLNSITIKQFLCLMSPLTTKKKIKNDMKRNIFDNYDKNRKGYLNINEFKLLIKSLGDDFSDYEIRELFKEADSDKNGKLDFIEFLISWDKTN